MKTMFLFAIENIEIRNDFGLDTIFLAAGVKSRIAKGYCKIEDERGAMKNSSRKIRFLF